MKYVYVLLALAISFSSSAYAAPTQEQTVSFINKMANKGRNSSSLELIFTKNQLVEINTDYEVSRTEPWVTYTIDLAQVNSIYITKSETPRLNRHGIFVGLKCGGKCIKSKFRGSDDISEYDAKRLGYFSTEHGFTIEEINRFGDKLANALQHYFKLQDREVKIDDERLVEEFF